MLYRTCLCLFILLVPNSASPQSELHKKQVEALFKRGILLLLHAPNQPVLLRFDEGVRYVFCLDMQGKASSMYAVGKASFANHDSILLTCNDSNVTIKTGYL